VARGDAGDVAQVEATLQEWRQGDVTLDTGLFIVHLAHKRLPLTKEARAALDGEQAEEDVFGVCSKVDGLIVVTQSCDIVKDCSKSEFVEVSPLVPVSEEALHEIRRGRLIRYAYVPGVAGRGLVADLDRTLAIEKSVVATWTRVVGCVTDDERVTFAAALARKRQRFAFPEGFNTGLAKFKRRLRENREKSTAEGRLIDALDDIRAEPHPDWDAPQVTVLFWFLLARDQDIDFDESRRVIERWMRRVALPMPFVLADPAFELVEQEDMTVRDYRLSHPLDYDDLSL
jgi:hypothetical protein